MLSRCWALSPSRSAMRVAMSADRSMCSAGWPSPRSIATDNAASNSARVGISPADGEGPVGRDAIRPILPSLPQVERLSGVCTLRQTPHAFVGAVDRRSAHDKPSSHPRRSPIMTERTLEPPTVDTFGTLCGGIDAVNVSRRVGRRQILQELSLSVKPGELVAIAGGSGAGKTTLLEILAGLQPPSAGDVWHDGNVCGPRGRGDSRIGYVPQDDIIHLEMPLRRTLRYAARLRL